MFHTKSSIFTSECFLFRFLFDSVKYITAAASRFYSVQFTVCPQSPFGVLKNCVPQTNWASHMRFASDYSETLEVFFFSANKMVLHLIGVCRYART
jgi:hypothetical protein